MDVELLAAFGRNVRAPVAGFSSRRARDHAYDLVPVVDDVDELVRRFHRP
jgi:hypothetical protein